MKTWNKEYLQKYFKYQQEICHCCELFSDKYVHGSKIIMLFAEVFSFVVDIYGLNQTSQMIINFSNRTIFKEWFWKTKHLLGESLKNDPDFMDIGKWIGKGFFLKICLSIILYNNLFFNQITIRKILKKQKNLLQELMNEEQMLDIINFNPKKNYYTILNDKTILNAKNKYFYNHNIIQ